MRIVSLLPSATEIVFLLGAGDEVVGVTFECDHPTEARSRRIVSTSSMPEGLSSREIDDFVAAALRRGEDLYHLDAGALGDLDADLVLTQDLCAVCAVDVRVVEDALAHLGCRADVLTLDPHTLRAVLDSVGVVGERIGRQVEASVLIAGLEVRLAAVAAAVAGRVAPAVAVLEWTDPPFAPGHWVPEMVTAAGGRSVLGAPGEKSVRTGFDAITAAGPDVVVCAPCGYGLQQSVGLAEDLVAQQVLPPDVPVWAVDANASFARPGPRLVDGIEALAGILHPDVMPLCDELARRVR